MSMYTNQRCPLVSLKLWVRCNSDSAMSVSSHRAGRTAYSMDQKMKGTTTLSSLFLKNVVMSPWTGTSRKADIMTNSGTEQRKALSMILTQKPSDRLRMPMSGPSMKKNSQEWIIMTMKHAITRMSSRNSIRFSMILFIEWIYCLTLQSYSDNVRWQILKNNHIDQEKWTFSVRN